VGALEYFNTVVAEWGITNSRLTELALGSFG
jgi:hypothetical protein